MSVIRKNLDDCIGCKTCTEICPMDVFYFNDDEMKSVMLYPENCQSCGQCYLYCQGRSLGMSTSQYGFAITAGRALRTFTELMPEEEEKSWGK